MKKILKMLLVLFLFMIILEVLFAIFGNGYILKYNILDGDKSYLIKEEYKANNKFDDHYEITINDKFYISIYDNLKKDSKLVKNVKSFEKDSLSCIYVTFKSKKIKRDVICNMNGRQVLYHNIRGYSSNLDEFVNKLSNYDKTVFEDKLSVKSEKGLVKVYNENIATNHFIDVQSYKGIYNIRNNNDIVLLDYYEHDVYNPSITINTSKYLISANYKDNYSFDSFYIIDISNNQKSEIKLNTPISYDSYFQGTVDNKAYIFDKNSKKQFEIDPKKETVKEVGNETSGILYYDGKWESRSTLEFTSGEVIFKQKVEYQNDSYDRIEKTDNFYYLFDYNGNKVRVSRKDLNSNYITELFEVTDIRNIKYVSDYMYFIEGDSIKYYSDRTGLRTLLNYSELNFNKNLDYFVYNKK